MAAAAAPINAPCNTGWATERPSHHATGTNTKNDPATATTVTADSGPPNARIGITNTTSISSARKPPSTIRPQRMNPAPIGAEYAPFWPDWHEAAQRQRVG